jgi:hypothetical protein
VHPANARTGNGSPDVNGTAGIWPDELSEVCDEVSGLFRSGRCSTGAVGMRGRRCCGGSCTPGQTAAITITATGLSPINVCVLPTNGTVTFTNSDTKSHTVVFSTPGCPTVGTIAAGGQATATFTTQENCSFQVDNGSTTGTVAVTSAMVMGGGY